MRFKLCRPQGFPICIYLSPVTDVTGKDVSPSGLKGKASHLLLEGKVNRTHVLTATAGFIMRWGTNLFDLIAIFVVVACLPIAIALAYLANHPFIG